MARYCLLIRVAIIIAVKLLVPCVKKRYTDSPATWCLVCGSAYGGGSCLRYGNG